jgi:ABC-type multidrug transport system fused ATPase/permease subunit
MGMIAKIFHNRSVGLGFFEAVLGFRFRYIFKILLITAFCALMDGLILGGVRIFLSIVTEDFTGVEFLKYSFIEPSLLNWSLLMGLLVALKLIFLYQKSVLSGDYFALFQKYYQKKMLLHYPRLSAQYYRDKGESAFYFNTDFRMLERGFEALFLYVQALVQFVVFIPVLFIISWRLSGIILLFMIPIIAISQKKVSGVVKPIDKLLEFRGYLHGRVERYLKIVKQWTHRPSGRAMNRILHSEVNSLAIMEQEVVRKKALLYGVSESVANAGTVFVCLLVGLFILHGGITSQNVILFLAALFFLYKPAKECSRMIGPYKDASSAWKNIQSFLEQKAKQQFQTVNRLPEINFENVLFGYDENLVINVRSLSLNVEKPLVITGANGIGKSTFLKVVAGIESPLSGKIKLPVAVEDIIYLDQDPLIPFVPLEYFEAMFSADCEDLLCKLKVSELIDALKKRGLCSLSELGAELSGGQRQRLALAVLLCSTAKLILLDEPTSFLPSTERSFIIAEISKFCKERNKMLVIVSHDQFFDVEGLVRIEWNEKDLLQVS